MYESCLWIAFPMALAAMISGLFLLAMIFIGTPHYCKECPQGFTYNYNAFFCAESAPPDITLDSDFTTILHLKCPCNFAYIGRPHEICMNLGNITDATGDIVCPSMIKLIDFLWYTLYFGGIPLFVLLAFESVKKRCTAEETKG